MKDRYNPFLLIDFKPIIKNCLFPLTHPVTKIPSEKKTTFF